MWISHIDILYNIYEYFKWATGYNMYTFCSEFCILVSSICWNFIMFGNWRKYTLRCSNPRSFSSDHISLYILLSYNWEAFQNSFLFGSIFYGRKIINILSLLTGLSNQQGAGCIFISNLLFLTPKLTTETHCYCVSGQVSKCMNRWSSDNYLYCDQNICFFEINIGL